MLEPLSRTNSYCSSILFVNLGQISLIALVPSLLTLRNYSYSFSVFFVNLEQVSFIAQVSFC